MTLQEWEDEKDRELDQQLTAFFQSAEPPAPRLGFVSRTMTAVRRAPLPAGRHPLRHSWTVAAGWGALVAACAFGAVGSQLLVGQILSSVIGAGVHGGMDLVQSVHTSSMVFDVLSTTSQAMLRTMSTREAAAVVAVLAIVAGASLTMLNKLLHSEKEPSSW